MTERGKGEDGRIEREEREREREGRGGGVVYRSGGGTQERRKGDNPGGSSRVGGWR